jgi:hypothetical protein
MRQLDHAATDSDFVAALVRDYLRPDAKGHFLADPPHQSSTSLTER